MVAQIISILAALAGLVKQLTSLVEKKRDQQAREKIKKLEAKTNEADFLKKTFGAKVQLAKKNEKNDDISRSPSDDSKRMPDDKYRRD